MTRLLTCCGLLMAAAWLYPLHLLPWMSWHSEALATLALLVGTAAALWTHYRSGAATGVLVPSVSALPLLIAMFAVAQWLAGRIAYAGSLWTILSYAAVCVAAATAGHAAAGMARTDAAQSLRVLAQMVLFTALAQVFIVFSQTLLLWLGSEWIARTGNEARGGGNMAQPNHAAQVFLVAMAAAVYLRELGRLGPRTLAATLVLLAGGVAVTQSRSGLLGAALLGVWYVVRRGAFNRPGIALPAMAFVMLQVLLFATWPKVLDFYWMADAELLNLTSSGRLEMWRQLLPAVEMRPMFGWGVMQVAEAQNVTAATNRDILPTSFAHNVLLDFALWLGVPATIVAVGMIARWSWPRLQQARTPDTLFCVAVVLPFAALAMTEFPYAYTYFLVPVFFALGVLDARLGRAAGVRLPRAAAAALLALGIGASVWAAVEYVAIEEDFRVARFEALRVGATPSEYEVPDIVILTQLEALLRATRVQIRPGMPEAELALLRNVAMLYPWGATNFRYATALALNGHMDEALRQLHVVRAMQGQGTYERLLRVLEERSVQYPVLQQLRLP